MAFQVYNSGNKCYVKMRAGRVLDNAKQPFEGIPIKSEMPPEPAESEPEVFEESTQIESTEPKNQPENEEPEKLDQSEDSQDGFWGFDY